jgi:protein phosphatase
LTRWRYAAATDTGLVRDSNQDAYFVDDAVAIVADGMGGHAAGEVASAMTVDVLYNGYLNRPTVDGLVQAIDEANRSVLGDAHDHPEHFGMGTTVIAVALVDDPNGSRVPVLFHVGDSRAYQLRDGALRQLSHDHSVAEEWVRMGRLTPEEALSHPRRHQLTRAIGVDQPLEIDVLSLAPQPGDRLLLCSDGLSNELSPDQLARLAGAGTLEEAVQALVREAQLAGGRDNITAVLLEFDAVGEASHTYDQVFTPMPPTPAPAPPVDAPKVPRKTRRFLTWRTGLAALVLVGVGYGVVAVLHWYAYSSYYLANDSGIVVIYQGQPNGVLWYKPKLVDVTSFKFSQLRRADQVTLAATVSEPSLTSAQQYIAYLHHQWTLSLPTTTTSTSTTTTTVKK